MGDIADDHQGYIHDELERMECDDGYYGGYIPLYSSRPSPRRAAIAVATPDDFDDVSAKPALPDDCSDLV